MTAIIIVASVLVGVSGVAVVIWSIADTRNRYYNEYISRKKND